MARSHRRKPWKNLQAHLPKILAGLVGAAVIAGGAYVVTKKSPEDHLKAGIALHKSGDFKGAEIELKNILQAEPDNGEARYMLGRIQFANGNHQAADKELRKARELGVKDADLAPLHARTLLMLNQPRRLLDEINTGESEKPETNAEIMALRARAYLALNDSIAAEDELANADALLPGHAETLVSRAFMALARNNPEDALALVDQALAKTEQRAEIWVMKGDLLRVLKRDAEALTAYAKAIALEAGNIPARLASAQLHLEASALEKAEADLKALAKVAPNNVMGRYLEAFIEFRRARFAEADAKLVDVLRTAPNFLPAHLLAGAVKLATGNREAAKMHLDKVLGAAPQHPLARKLMAATLANLGDVDQARKILSSFEGAGKDPIVDSLQGELALRQGDYALARKHFEKMDASAAQSPKFFTELAASRMGTGDQAGAIAALTKAAELDTASAKPDVLLVLAHMKEKRYDEASRVIDKLEKERPDDPLVQNLRGAIFIAREDKTQARASFGKALQMKPGYFPAASNLALLDMMDKDFKAARSRFEQLLKSAPNESRAWLALAALDAREKNDAAYLKNLEQAKKADGKNIQPHNLLARYWLGKKDGGKAVAAAREGLDATGRIEFQELIGLAQLLQKDQASALASFTRWAEGSPANPMAHFRMAQMQIEAKDHAGALKSLEKAISLRPDFVEATQGKALVLGKLGRGAEAIKLAREMQAAKPKAAAGYLTEAEVLLLDKKYSEAGKLFVKAANAAGQGQWLARAYQAYAAAGQSTEGENQLAQWLKAHPDDAQVRHLLATTHLNARRLQDSAEQYRVLVRGNPKDLVAYNNLAWLLGELKDPTAIAISEQAFKLNPENPAIMDTLGWNLINMGQSQRGLDMLRKALSRAPDALEIHWHLASALVKTGDRAQGRKELEKLLEKGRSFPQETEARKLLESLK
jgi:putative PEP-CTERM system TPR-repeat lipoprotein